MPWVDKNEWLNAMDVPSARRVGRLQLGRNNLKANRDSPSPYKALYAKVSRRTPSLPNGQRQPLFDAPNAYFARVIGDFNVPFPVARNGAWESLFENIRGETADLAVTMAEWNESLSMIAQRGSQLVRAARALRRGRFKKFTRELRVNPKRKHRNLTRKQVINDFSGLWLEYSFGWSPLLGDIYAAGEAISEPIPYDKYIGRGNESVVVSTSNANFTVDERFTTVGRCEQGAQVQVINPNLYLLQQMGVANPLLVAWEVIPFSFLVDWVFDVSSFLGSLTDQLGLDLTKTYTTYSMRGVTVSQTFIWYGSREYTLSGRMSAMRRDVGLSRPMPNMSFLANIGTNWRRAANAVSLLGVLLTGRTT